jgi:hypothetical protein
VRGQKGRTAAPKPVDYWVRGVFRSGHGEHTHTVQAVGMSPHLGADIARFVDYPRDHGFQFPEGRAVLMEVLGVGTDDGVTIALSGRGDDDLVAWFDEPRTPTPR